MGPRLFNALLSKGLGSLQFKVMEHPILLETSFETSAVSYSSTELNLFNKGAQKDTQTSTSVHTDNHSQTDSETTDRVHTRTHRLAVVH